MKSFFAILLSAVAVTLIVWAYGLLFRVEDPNTVESIVLSSDTPISEEVFLEINQEYEDLFANIIHRVYHRPGSVPSVVLLFIFMLPCSALSILFFLGIIRILKRKSKPVAGKASDLPGAETGPSS
jgi:hypothetical protein